MHLIQIHPEIAMHPDASGCRLSGALRNAVSLQSLGLTPSKSSGELPPLIRLPAEDTAVFKTFLMWLEAGAKGDWLLPDLKFFLAERIESYTEILMRLFVFAERWDIHRLRNASYTTLKFLLSHDKSWSFLSNHIKEWNKVRNSRIRYMAVASALQRLNNKEDLTSSGDVRRKLGSNPEFLADLVICGRVLGQKGELVLPETAGEFLALWKL